MVALERPETPSRLGLSSLAEAASGPSHIDIWRRAPEPVPELPEPGVTRLSDILCAWRAAERALDEVSDQAAEAAALQREVDAWRTAYHQVSARLRIARAEPRSSGLTRWPA